MRKTGLETLYRKVKGRYTPCGITESYDAIPNGIWYIRSKESMKSMTSIQHIGEMLKIGDAEDISFNTLCGLEDMCNEIMSSKEWNELFKKPYSLNEVVHLVVKKCYDKSNKKQNE